MIGVGIYHELCSVRPVVVLKSSEGITDFCSQTVIWIDGSCQSSATSEKLRTYFSCCVVMEQVSALLFQAIKPEGRGVQGADRWLSAPWGLYLKVQQRRATARPCFGHSVDRWQCQGFCGLCWEADTDGSAFVFFSSYLFSAINHQCDFMKERSATVGCWQMNSPLAEGRQLSKPRGKSQPKRWQKKMFKCMPPGGPWLSKEEVASPIFVLAAEYNLSGMRKDSVGRFSSNRPSGFFFFFFCTEAWVRSAYCFTHTTCFCSISQHNKAVG